MSEKIQCPCCGNKSNRKPNKAGFLQDEACRTILKVEDGKARVANLEETVKCHAYKDTPNRFPNKGDLIASVVMGSASNFAGYSIDELSRAVNNEMGNIDRTKQDAKRMKELSEVARDIESGDFFKDLKGSKEEIERFKKEALSSLPKTRAELEVLKNKVEKSMSEIVDMKLDSTLNPQKDIQAEQEEQGFQLDA